jgi:hypothetical protein
MSNYNKEVNIFTARVDKGMINKKSLLPLFDGDADFTENEDYFREDTLENWESEAERVSEEIYEKHLNHEGTEMERLEDMVNELYDLDNFIGNSNHYGDGKHQIYETAFEYIIVIAVIG